MGSYRQWEPWLQSVREYLANRSGRKPKTFLHGLSFPARYRYDPTGMIAILADADAFYVVSKMAFPWVDDDKKVVFEEAFAPKDVGKYDGAYILAPSCLVEAGLMPLRPYLLVLNAVFERLIDRGLERVYVKYHPSQRRNADNFRAYSEVAAKYGGRIKIIELPTDAGLENIAAGSSIVLVSGLSSTMVYAWQLGRQVLTYNDLYARCWPERRLVAPDLAELFARIADPL